MRTKITSCLIKNLLESRQNILETASGCSRQYVGTYPLLRRDVSDATSGRNFFRINGEVMNKDCSWQYMADNP